MACHLLLRFPHTPVPSSAPLSGTGYYRVMSRRLIPAMRQTLEKRPRVCVNVRCALSSPDADSATFDAALSHQVMDDVSALSRHHSCKHIARFSALAETFSTSCSSFSKPVCLRHQALCNVAAFQRDEITDQRSLHRLAG